MERLLEVNEDVIEVLLVLEVLLAQCPKVEDLLCCAASWSEACLFLSDDLFRLRLQSVQQDFQHNVNAILVCKYVYIRMCVYISVHACVCVSVHVGG